MIPFIDLQSQRALIATDLDAAIARVLEHGQSSDGGFCLRHKSIATTTMLTTTARSAIINGAKRPNTDTSTATKHSNKAQKMTIMNSREKRDCPHL
jgi:hypothetical protein